MKKYFIPGLLSLVILSGCNQVQPEANLPGSPNVVLTDDFNVSKYVSKGASNISTVTLEMTGEGAAERAVYFEEKGVQNVSLMRKVGEEYEEQVAYFFTHSGDNPKYLKEQKAMDMENDGREELLFHFVSPTLENPQKDTYAFVKYINDEFKFIATDPSFNPPQ